MCRMQNAATARCLCRRIGGFEWWDNAVRTLRQQVRTAFCAFRQGRRQIRRARRWRGGFLRLLAVFLCDVCFNHLICVQIFCGSSDTAWRIMPFKMSKSKEGVSHCPRCLTNTLLLPPSSRMPSELKNRLSNAPCVSAVCHAWSKMARCGFEAAQVVLCGQDGRRNDDALFVGQTV